MSAELDKSRVLEALRSRLAENLDALLASQRTVQTGAVHEENRQEHAKDTRAIEQTYLARGLAERVEDMTEVNRRVAALHLESFGPDDPISVTALVTLTRESGGEEVYFLAPFGGGERLEVDGVSVQVLTPRAPLGLALVGRCAGDDVEVDLPSGRVEATITRVT